MATNRFPIDVAASVIADISAGIYRTPAGALKELISNAFDADARTVRITTNAPHFRTFTCTDDGLGLTPEKFKQVMRLIGGSSKRDQGDVSPVFGRPLIGRIGIGLLAIGQICRRFEVFSSAKGSAVKFRAQIDLEPYMRAEARRTQLGSPVELEKGGAVKIGEYEIEEAEEEPSRHYTRVVMESIIPGFQQQLLSQPTIQLGVTPKSFKKADMAAFLASVSKDTVSEHGAYAQLIWELAVSAPTQYLPDGPVRNQSRLNDLRARVKDYNFTAFIDGVELFKPILLPTRRSIPCKLHPHLDLDKSLPGGRRLRARGYLFWQKERILPRELQGVLVRVRNVAIGSFDPTYLGYPKHEGWKFSQLCGELYVDEGLDEAINIDRASFRETDEAYLALQNFLFQRLGKATDQGAGIFTNIKSLSGKLSQKRKKRETAARAKGLAGIVFGQASAAQFRVAQDDQPTPTGVRITSSEVVIDQELTRSIPPRQKDLFISVCAVIEKRLARALPAGKRRELFRELAELFGVK